MDILLTNEDGEKKPVTLRALHCVFESQNGQRCRELFLKLMESCELLMTLSPCWITMSLDIVWSQHVILQGALNCCVN